ncbi:MAG: hypothetical protein ACOC9S_04210 [Planctomycetota bacterium]
MARKKLMFIGCDVMYREACALAARTPHRVDLRFLPKSMHDDSDAMRRDIQEAVDAVDPEQGYHAILLGTGDATTAWWAFVPGRYHSSCRERTTALRCSSALGRRSAKTSRANPARTT